MTKFLSLIFAFGLLSAAFSCQNSTETKTENSNIRANSVQPSNTPVIAIKSEQTIPVDVAKLVNKSIAELDKTFGAPLEATSIADGGAFRLYKIAGQSKGAAVWFLNGKARSFNLIVDSPFPTSREALKQVFNIDVGSSAPLKDAKEPLSESYRGTFGGVKFKKVSAKRAGNGEGFIFVLAEVAE